MPMPWLAALEYAGIEFEATVPMRPFDHAVEWEGGTMEAASGLVESFTILTKRELDVTIRVREAEVQTLIDAVSYGVRNPGLLTFYPTGLAGTGYPVYVTRPKVGERWSPTRGQMDSFEGRITLRRVDGQGWDLNYFSPPA